MDQHASDTQNVLNLCEMFIKSRADLAMVEQKSSNIWQHFDKHVLLFFTKSEGLRSVE